MSSLDELIARAVQHGEEEVNFDVGERFPMKEWHDAERRIGRWLPVTWLRFVEEFGAGSIDVERPKVGGGELDLGGPDRFQSGDWVGARSRGFDLEVCAPQSVEPLDDCFSDGRDGWQVWCRVGQSLCGDALVVRSDASWKQRPEDAEFAWYNHELGDLTYRWPGLVELLGHLLDWHAHGRKQVVGQRRIDAYRKLELLKRRELAATLTPKPATPNQHGWVKCPHCGIRFMLSDGRSWDGQLHVDSRCMKRIEIMPR